MDRRVHKLWFVKGKKQIPVCRPFAKSVLCTKLTRQVTCKYCRLRMAARK